MKLLFDIHVICQLMFTLHAINSKVKEIPKCNTGCSSLLRFEHADNTYKR